MKYLLVLIFIYILYNVLGTQENFTSGVVSPDILEATKKGTRAKIVFQDSVRNAAIFDKYLAPSITPEHEYMIFYIDEDNYKKTMLKDNTKLEVPSNTTSTKADIELYKSRLELYNYLKKQDSKFDLNKWQKNTMKCYKNKCKIYLNNLNSEKYRLIVLKKEGENISTIRKVIEFSEEKPYKVFNLSENEEENSFLKGKLLHSLKTMHYFNKLSFFDNNPLDAAELIGYSRVLFITRKRDIQIQMSMDRLEEGRKKFLLILDTIDKKTPKIQMIDLSFKDQVVIRNRFNSSSILISGKSQTN